MRGSGAKCPCAVKRFEPMYMFRKTYFDVGAHVESPAA